MPLTKVISRIGDVKALIGKVNTDSKNDGRDRE